MGFSAVLFAGNLGPPKIQIFQQQTGDKKRNLAKNKQKHSLRPILMKSDWWIEKGDFRSKTKSCILTQSKKCLFDPNFFDRAIQSAHPVEKVEFFNGMHGADCSIEKVFEAHRISHQPRKHTITPYNSSDAGLTAAAAAHSESAWHILFSARQQHVPSSDGSSARCR